MVTLDPGLGARTSLYCALEPDLETGGSEAPQHTAMVTTDLSYVRGYYDNCREAELSRLARDEESAAKLWQLSAAIVQLEQ